MQSWQMQRTPSWNQPWQQAMGVFQQTVGAMVEATTHMGEMTSEVLKELRESCAERAQLLKDARKASTDSKLPTTGKC